MDKVALKLAIPRVPLVSFLFYSSFNHCSLPFTAFEVYSTSGFINSDFMFDLYLGWLQFNLLAPEFGI